MRPGCRSSRPRNKMRIDFWTLGIQHQGRVLTQELRRPDDMNELIYFKEACSLYAFAYAAV